MKILVCGGRNYSNYVKVENVLSNLNPTMIIRGGATGADFLAKRWAIDKNVPFEEYKAEWKLYGRAAGPKRNEKMLKESSPDLVVAFQGGSGTQHMVSLAKRNNVKVIEIDEDT